jgi:16S rRNA processing protein RimM
MATLPPGSTGGESLVVVGKISGVYGIKGWMKVLSYTRPRENLLEFEPWLIARGGAWRPVRVLDNGVSGGAITVRLDAVGDRDAARQLVGAEIAVDRRQLRDLPQGQYYWSDLVGLRVVTSAGRDFGRVTGLMETGANDVLEVQAPTGRMLIPFVPGHVIKGVDLAAGSILVDWDPEYQ